MRLVGYGEFVERYIQGKVMGHVTHSVRYRKGTAETAIAIERHVLRDLRPGEVLVKVSAVGLNRADVLQREGIYIPPDGETDVPGVEVAGEIVACASEAFADRIGERVCGVVSGGGFSEYCILEEAMVMCVPQAWTDVEAAAFPEAALTANEALFGLAGLREGDTVLLHAASSGMGTMLLAMAKRMGVRTICTTTSVEKKATLLELGADVVIASKEPDFAAATLALTDGMGVDAIVDFLAGRYANENISAVTRGGCVVVAGIMDGGQSNLNWIPLINRSVRILPLTLRMKPAPAKHDVTSRFLSLWWDGEGYRGLEPILGLTFSLSELDRAQARMKQNRHVGKIVIDCREGWTHD